MATDLLQVESLARSFGAFQVLKDVSFSVRPGEIVGLLGPNGSGKSTALNIVSGFLPRSAGKVMFGAHDISDASVMEITNLGLKRTFQLPSMPHRMTVREVLRTGRQEAGSIVAPVVYGVEIDEVLSRFNLLHVADQPASALSGGQKKLLSVATALRSAPRLLCLDEPTAGVHISLRQQMIQVLRDYVASGGACLVVEHDMLFVRELCHRCVVLDRGEIIADCDPNTLEENARVVEAYLGKSVETARVA